MRTLLILIAFIGLSLGSMAQSQLADNQPHDAILYPNPMVGTTLKINSFNPVKNIEIRNIIGQVVYFESEPSPVFDNQYEISVNLKHEGIYFVTLAYEGKKSLIKRLLVK